jgi:integrase
MRLLLAGVGITVIALWLGHESISSTQEYLHADMQQKQEATGKTASPGSRQKRYQPPDQLLQFLENL